MEHPINILEHFWNYTEFKPMQEDVINAVIDGHDTLALMPTGGGKSLCFQVPSLAKDGICIVISPLIALMKDQVNILKDKGIKAMALTSGIPYHELDTLLDNCIYGNYKFLYLSPERLQQELVRDRIRQMDVNLIAVDEAHCISQWGNDFRPAYKNIKTLREIIPSVNIIALTATATPDVVQDIINELDLIDLKSFKQSFARPNIAFMTFDEEDKYYRIEKILEKNLESSIIYVRNRKLTVEISKHLENKGFKSIFYHGGISSDQKSEHLNKWLSNEKQVMVATSAFGMGIDKPDVKTVIHFNLPESIESYYQEAGRAGRNGNKAFSIVLKNKSDEQLLKNQFLQVLPSVKFIKGLYRKLCNYFQISFGEGEFTSHEFNFNKFCKTYDFNPLIAYNALQILDRTSIVKMSQQFNKRSSVQFIVNNERIFSYLKNHSQIDAIVKSILRTYGGIFDQEVSIKLEIIANKAEVKIDTVVNVLRQLERDEMISLKLFKTDAEITFLQPREDDRTINRIASIIKQQNDLKSKKIEDILGYVNNNDTCKSRLLLSYFGETKLEDCGICSVCIKEPTDSHNVEYTVEQIVSLLNDKPHTSREISNKLTMKESQLTQALKLMLENNIITITKTNSYKLKQT
ncbi:MAG: RecQ family ATP-dependent DNA helicase [Flavobacteriaceae bacterium]|nr:RecQ family ATP-dependent DNA helicase [Flavobacteriaceae bacterium]